MEEEKQLDQLNLEDLKKKMLQLSIVKSTDMGIEMQQDVQETITAGIDGNGVGSSINIEAACKQIKEQLDKKYGPTWQCIIGEGYAYDVTVQNQTLLFMFYQGSLAILQEIKDKLSKLQYSVTQESATERPYTGKYNEFYEDGVYQCIVCEQELFHSQNKYDSGCGWPAFYKGIDDKIKEQLDTSYGRIRTEVVCNVCNAHLGHKFNDGPKNLGGVRYCINSASLKFQKKQ